MASTRKQGEIYITLPDGIGGGGGVDPAILATKMDKVTDATAGNVAIFKQDGNVTEILPGSEGQVLTQGENGAEWKDPTGGELMVPITYAELKELRNNGNLVPGQQYRITDYDCTTGQEGTDSAHNKFDIIVVADDESTLNENARAAKSDSVPAQLYLYFNEGADFVLPAIRTSSADKDISGVLYYCFSAQGFDVAVYSTSLTPEDGSTVYTYNRSRDTMTELDYSIAHFTYVSSDYFENCDLSAWELKYCLDNDTERFAWATSAMVVDMVINNELTPYRRYSDGDSGGKFAWKNCDRDYEYKEDGEVIFTDSEVPSVGDVTYHDTYEDEVYSIEREGSRYDGKGVIYYMKDEWGNACPYDFKNIKIQEGYSSGFSFYTFVSESSMFSDYSISSKVRDNKIEPYKGGDVAQQLNGIMIASLNNGNIIANNFGVDCRAITLIDGSHNTFGGNCNGIQLSIGDYNTFAPNTGSGEYGNITGQTIGYLDDDVTSSSANGVKSSGIYSYVNEVVGNVETLLEGLL